MRSLSVKLLTAAVFALLASTAFGQGRGGLMQGPALLLNKSVQDELKLSAEQKATLKKAEQQMEKAGQAFRTGDREKAQELFSAARGEAEKVAGDLKPEQRRRLRQITLQAAGPAAFRAPKIQEDLNLTDKQKDEIQSISENLQKQAQEVFQGVRDNPRKLPGAMKKFNDLRKQALDKIESKLTAEQKKKWRALAGPKFDLKMETSFFGGRGQRPKGKE